MPALSTVLLIEDEPDNAHLFAEILRYHGFDVEGVETLVEGADRLASAPFSLVLTDYITGRTDEAAARASQLLDAAGSVPVVCVTAWRSLPPALAERFAFVLYKPFSAGELLSIVSTITSVAPRPSENEHVASYFDALTRRDWDALAALCRNDVVYRAPQSDLIVGRDSFRDFSRRTFADYPDARFELIDVTPLPRGAVARYRSQWTLPNKEIARFEGAVTFGFVAGEISHIDVRMDLGKLSQALETDRPPRLEES